MDEKKTEIKSEIQKNSNINGILLILFWVFYLLATAVSMGVSKILPEDLANSDGINTIIVYTFLYPIGISLSVFIANKLKNRHLTSDTAEFEKAQTLQKVKDSFRKPDMPASWTAKFIIISIFMAYAASFITVIVTMLITLIFGSSPHSVSFHSEPSVATTIATILATTIYAPIFEEIFFRGTLYRNVQKYGTWSMILIAGITFGIWHANFSQIFFASVVGVCSCFIYEKTKSIIPSIILHFCINTIGCSATLITNYLGIDPSSPETATTSVMENLPAFVALVLVELVVFTLCLLGLVFLIVELCSHRESFRLEKRNTELSEPKKLVAYLTAPAMLIIMVGMIVLSVLRTIDLSPF